MRSTLTIVALLIAGLGWAGATGLDGPERLGYLGGALTLAGAVVICLLFTFQARWLGIGGAVVVALLGAARNAPALLDLARGDGGAPEWCRLAIAAVCVVLFAAGGRALLAMRRAGDPAP